MKQGEEIKTKRRLRDVNKEKKGAAAIINEGRRKAAEEKVIKECTGQPGLKSKAAVNKSTQGQFWKINQNEEEKTKLGPSPIYYYIIKAQFKPNCQAQSVLGPRNIQSPL
jgi:hypothetical protein